MEKTLWRQGKMFSTSRIKSGCQKITARVSVKFPLTKAMRRGGGGRGGGGVGSDFTLLVGGGYISRSQGTYQGH